MHTCPDTMSEHMRYVRTGQNLLQSRKWDLCIPAAAAEHRHDTAMMIETASLVPEVLKAGQRLPILVQHLPWLIQHVCIEALAQDSHPCHGRLDLVIPHQGNGVIQMVEEQALCTRLLHQLQQQATGADQTSRSDDSPHEPCEWVWSKAMTPGSEPAAGGHSRSCSLLLHF